MSRGERTRRPPEPGTESEESSPAVAVARAVAEREGCEPGELWPPLAAVVDADALNALTDGEARVSFGYLGYDVTVGDDRVTVTDRD